MNDTYPLCSDHVTFITCKDTKIILQSLAPSLQEAESSSQNWPQQKHTYPHCTRVDNYRTLGLISASCSTYKHHFGHF
jgi:hypothetical protein